MGHHRYIDTDLDPYNAKRGFFFSHVGWMLMKQDYSNLGHVDVSDLNASKAVRAQHVHYLKIAMLSGIVLPTLICGLGWGDWLGGYFYAALAKMVFVHHTTFFINSLAHSPLFAASQNFSDQVKRRRRRMCFPTERRQWKTKVEETQRTWPRVPWCAHSSGALHPVQVLSRRTSP